MNELILSIQQTIKHLDQSEKSDWSSLTPEEVKEILQGELTKIEDGQKFYKLDLRVLYAVTSNIQEIAMTNYWHDEYIEISNVIDKFTDSNYLLK